MNLLAIFQLRTKRYWWMDVILYLVSSLLVATAFCYFIFLIKDGMVKNEINRQNRLLQDVGTQRQKDHETEVLKYKKKIGDFSNILNNHKFVSNVFVFMQNQTMPNIWFNQFSLDPKNISLQIQGESDDLDGLSRQVLALEKNEYIKGIGTLSSSQSQSSKIQFSMAVSFNPKILTYVKDLSLAQMLRSEEIQNQQNQSGNNNQTNNNQGNQPSESGKSSQKLITSFYLLLDPKINGQIDQNKKIITVVVPYGTDLKKIVPSIAISDKASINPPSLIPQDFSHFVDYKVTAEDDSTQSYRVSVAIAPTKQNQNNAGKWWIVGIIIVLLIGAVATVLIFLNKKKSIKTENHGY